MNKILVIGSGPIVIGQAAEFDYAGTQGCLALKELGYEVVLLNPNPATIMTDTHIADKVYIEPITLDTMERIIRLEKIEGILPNLGGQTGLNAAMELYKSGLLETLNVKLLGTSFETIADAEDRERFKNLMQKLEKPIPDSKIVTTIEDGVAFAHKTGFPLIIRPAYTLGGSGGGKATNEESLKEILASGLLASPVNQVLVEKDISGYKEIEFEVMRDSSGQKMVICTMENMDPVGIHTGDSIVFAPAQTLTPDELEMLRNCAFKIMDAIDLQGGCNVQFAFDPHSKKYYVIEINPRVSRSSSLASKATGYAIAKISAAIATGKLLKDLPHPIIKEGSALEEPLLDYVVCKIPRWPFDKFKTGDRSLTTQMKATGEVMSLAPNKEMAFMKALRSLENGHTDLKHKQIQALDDLELSLQLTKPNDERIFVLAEALRRGYSVEDLHTITKMDRFYIEMLERIVSAENSEDETLKAHLGYQTSLPPIYRQVDGSAGLKESKAPYFYSSLGSVNESIPSNKEKVIVLGSGPIRIGQGVEFDYATVHCVKTLQELGYEAILINNNPETVSTDFEFSDKLYFEPLTHIDVMNIINLEKPIGVIVQFGGQTAINLAQGLEDEGVTILGTSMKSIAKAEDRDQFTQLLNELEVCLPKGYSATNTKDLVKYAKEIGYPVLVRPSFVIGGESMKVINDDSSLEAHLNTLNFTHPVLVDKYISGKEVEVDAISDGTHVLLPGIMEHIEKSGVHSGDSMALYPPQTLSQNVIDTITHITTKLALALDIKGMMNVQFIVSDEDVYVIEVNPRASRTLPFMSKVTGIPITKEATHAIMGKTLSQSGLIPNALGIHVKAPVFSFAKLRSVDAYLSPEMKSTGEVMGSDTKLENALYKAFVASGYNINDKGSVIITVKNEDKSRALEIARKLNSLGIEILTTKGTHTFFTQHNIDSRRIGKVNEDTDNILEVIKNTPLSFVINTGDFNDDTTQDGFLIRRVAVEQGIPLLTSFDTADALIKVLESQIQKPWRLS